MSTRQQFLNVVGSRPDAIAIESDALQMEPLPAAALPVMNGEQASFACEFGDRRPEPGAAYWNFLIDVANARQRPHTADADCVASASLDVDGNCTVCLATADDPCPACFGVRYHRENCPCSDGTAGLGGCGLCTFGLLMDGRTDRIVACDECATNSRGFTKDNTPDDDFAQYAALHLIRSLERIRELLFPSAEGPAINRADAWEAMRRELAYLRRESDDEAAPPPTAEAVSR